MVEHGDIASVSLMLPYRQGEQRVDQGNNLAKGNLR